MKNKNLLALALIATGLTATSAFAQDSMPNQTAKEGWFVDANAGYANVSKGPYDSGDFAGGLKGGYRWAVNPEAAIGLEAGYQELGNVSPRNSYSAQDGDAKSRLGGYIAGAHLRYSIGQHLYAELRGGAFYAMGRGLTDAQPADSYRRDFNKTNFYSGVGVGYDINQHFGVGLDYNYYKGTGNGVNLNTNAYTVNAEYRF